jgi:HSP20 family protein
MRIGAEVMMAPVSRKILREIHGIQIQHGRMLRNMSFTKMFKIKSGCWQPPIDVYEAGEELILYCDLAGVVKESLELLVEEHQVQIRGLRQLPGRQTIVCVHQLEIELGAFSRTLILPAMIDVEHVKSSYVDGILVVSLRKRMDRQVVVRIRIED